LPPRSFFWAVYKTKFPGKAQAYIDAAMKQKLGEQEEDGELIKIGSEFLKNI